MATQTELLMTAARQVVDAELAFAAARDQLVFAKAQYSALTHVIHDTVMSRDVDNASDVLRAVVDIDRALHVLSEFSVDG